MKKATGKINKKIILRREMWMAIIALVSIYFFLSISNSLNSESKVIELVSAVRADGGDTYIVGKDAKFESKILDFLKVDKLCAVTSDQANILKQAYTLEIKEYYVVQQAKTVFVFYVDGPKASLAQFEKLVGPIDDGNCKVVHGGGMLAILGP